MKANRIKTVSKLRRYEFLRELGVYFGNDAGEYVLAERQELDDKIDELIWRKAHPGEDPNVDFGEPNPVMSGSDRTDSGKIGQP